jgi:hypothetical protein
MSQENQIKLNNLNLKKNRLLSEIEMLSTVDSSMFTNLGRTVSEIHRIEKEIVRSTENIINEN